jgi:hypothetical protein
VQEHRSWPIADDIDRVSKGLVRKINVVKILYEVGREDEFWLFTWDLAFY